MKDNDSKQIKHNSHLTLTQQIRTQILIWYTVVADDIMTNGT